MKSCFVRQSRSFVHACCRRSKRAPSKARHFALFFLAWLPSRSDLFADTLGVQRYTVNYARLSMTPGKIHRRFLCVPTGATSANITVVTPAAFDGKRRLVLHCVQLLPQTSFVKGELQKYINVGAQARKSFRMPVQAGVTLEVCLAQFWSSLGAAVNVSVEVEFDGVELLSSETNLLAGGQ